MSISLIAIASLSLAAPVASAEQTRGHHPAAVSAALKAGCQVQQVHTPSGKTVQSAPLIRCSPDQVAARDAILSPAADTAVRGTN